jgi:DNA recombination protein RmuC
MNVMDIVIVALLVVTLATVVWSTVARGRQAEPVGWAGPDPLLGQQLQQLSESVHSLTNSTMLELGRVQSSLSAQAEVSSQLRLTTAGLREALANSNARGQWGERMAEDVLRLAGLLPNVNYVKRTALAGDARGIPDFTFLLPDEHVMFMDVKFPIDSYLAYLQAGTDAERELCRDQFLRAVKGHVRTLAAREYARLDDRPSVQNVLMFVPNESVVSFIHEQSPALIDEALREGVLLCSPLTLFAFLGVIRQAFENFRLQQSSREMLAVLGQFGVQWRKYHEQLEKMRRQLDTFVRGMDDLTGPRRRQLERPLAQLDELRRAQGIEVATPLVEADLDADPDGTSALPA